MELSPKTNIKKKNIIKKSRLYEEEDAKNLRSKIKGKISAFLDDFLEENKLKRANSMKSLRQSKTISSFTTCDDSICLEDTKEGKLIINLNNIMVNNGDINQANQKTKEMIQRSKNLYEVYLDQKKGMKESNDKFGKTIGQQKDKSFNLLMNMIPQFKEAEEEMEGINIEYKDKDKNIINSISIDLLLKKIIFENYLEKHTLLIYHFCQQCFCFVNKEILFKKLFHCYTIYKNKKISIDNFKNLIEFINVLVVDMFDYYDKIKYKEMQIDLIKKYYNELISDLICNFKKEEKIENKIEEICNDNNDIIPNKGIFRFNSFDMNGEHISDLSNTDIKLDRINLINTDLNLDIKNINIFIFKDKENNLLQNDWSYLGENDTKEKENNTENTEEKKAELPKLYKISKTIRRSLESPKTSTNIDTNKNNKMLIKIEEEIYNEEGEDSLFSDKEENDKSIGEINEKEEYSYEDPQTSSDNEEINNIQIEDEEEEEKKKTETLNNLFNKVFDNNDNIISIKEELLKEIKNIIPLLEVKDEGNIYQQSLREAKEKIPFYSEIKNKKKVQKKETKNIISSNVLEKSKTTKISDISIKKNNINNKKYFCITDWPKEEIANKLTQVTKSHLNKIKPRELYKGVYLKKDKEKTSPNVVKSINSFNGLTSFIIEDILSYSTPRLRAKSYERWVKICDYCKNNKNYNDCIAIFSALNNYIITGLYLTLKEIKSNTKSTFEQISNFCSVEGNYKNIRNDMNLCEEKGITFIPYLGMLLRDINFMEESNKYINEKGCINMDKIEKINSLLEKYFRYKKEDKKKNEDKTINKELSFLENLEILTEEELEKIAENVEPEYKYDKTEVKRRTKTDEKHFGKVLLKKRATISDTKTVFGKNSNLNNLLD